MMRYLVRQPESIFNKFFEDLSPSTLGKNLDIYKQDNKYIVEVDLPGFTKEDITVDYHEDILTIKAEKTQETNEEKDDKKYVYRSRQSTSMTRRIRFEDINQEEISGNFENGVLKLELPLAQEVVAEAKRIEIK